MSGGYLHHQVLLNPLEQEARRRGAWVEREARISDSPPRYADLLIELGSVRIVVEAELATTRLVNDLIKAALLQAQELWVVVPNAAALRAARRGLLRLSVRPTLCGIFVLTLPQALQRLAITFPLISTASVLMENGKQIAAPKHGDSTPCA